MNVLLILAILITGCSSCMAQNIKSSISGEWTTSGAADLLEKNDTITFYQDINFAYKKHLFRTLDIAFSDGNKVIISDVIHCAEPGRVKTYTDASRYHVSKQKDKVTLTIFINAKHANSKKIIYSIISLETHQIDSYPFETKTMRIIKI